MKYFTFEEFRDWILEQSDKKPIDMGYNGAPSRDRTGCVLGQFGKAQGLEFHCCGWNNLIAHSTIAIISGECKQFITAAILFGRNGDGVTNFGEAKKVLKSIK